MATVRHIVKDVDAARAFYVDRLGFTLKQQFGPNMAIVQRDGITLWLTGPGASASRPMPDGAVPQSGEWNRFVLEMQDLQQTVDSLRRAGVRLRNDIVSGPGGQQILCEDPSGNVIELFQPA